MCRQSFMCTLFVLSHVFSFALSLRFRTSNDRVHCVTFCPYLSFHSILHSPYGMIHKSRLALRDNARALSPLCTLLVLYDRTSLCVLLLLLFFLSIPFFSRIEPSCAMLRMCMLWGQTHWIGCDKPIVKRQL